jgi:hypothetical protein
MHGQVPLGPGTHIMSASSPTSVEDSQMNIMLHLCFLQMNIMLHLCFLQMNIMLHLCFLQMNIMLHLCSLQMTLA